MTFADRLRQLLTARGMSYGKLAAKVFYTKGYLHDLAHGRRTPTLEAAQRLDEALAAEGTLAVLAAPSTTDEDAAAELARRVSASDVSAATLAALEVEFDRLAMSYATTPPGQLIGTARHHLAQVGQLLDARTTLAHHRQLIVLGGWFSLLAATLHIDLQETPAAAARLSTAATMAEHSEHPEIRAWCLETRAWDAVTSGDYRTAVRLSQQAKAAAPRGSSALIQATAQEGRAWARMGEVAHTRKSLDAVARLVANLPQPDQPEHHYRYDPGKALAYTATTLAWAGDPAAVEYTRAVIAQLEGEDARPRRVASARLDLGLALLASRELDEAAEVATLAVASGRVVASNWWRATEIVTAVEQAGLSQAGALREAYEAFRP